MKLGKNTFYHGDCLFVLNHDIEPESVDLIYLDPPFFTGKTQTEKWRTEWHPDIMEVSFEDRKDYWAKHLGNMRMKAPDWLNDIATRHKRGELASYLYYMMERLQACHKVLKNTGSIYLHCDWRASHYLKIVMDEVFESDNFRNEIVWYYHRWTAISQDFQRLHDTILRYSKNNNYIFTQLFDDYQETTLKYHRWEVDENGRKYYMKHGKTIAPYKVYLDEKGVKLGDVWELPQLGPISDKRMGYPTQKPPILLSRIIRASSKDDSVILDPFCGCGTTLIEADKLGKKWIGIDINKVAFSVIKNKIPQLFEQSKYVSRDLAEVLEMKPKEFEDWVNEFYKANKPSPDRGVDGITKDEIPIQTKTFRVGYETIDKLVSSSKYHPLVHKPIKEIIVVSQTGFDDSARQRQFQIEKNEGIKVHLETPETMLGLDTQ